uniref:Putative glycoprotein n=1 Tax=Soybean thrips bunya-like virus 4 TaxID=2800862 RepID=A0A7T8JID4_9VIRU|nr:putative glycoprotein [Soybean thrips bunya-like virus 4]
MSKTALISLMIMLLTWDEVLSHDPMETQFNNGPIEIDSNRVEKVWTKAGDHINCWSLVGMISKTEFAIQKMNIGICQQDLKSKKCVLASGWTKKHSESDIYICTMDKGLETIINLGVIEIEEETVLLSVRVQNDILSKDMCNTPTSRHQVLILTGDCTEIHNHGEIVKFDSRGVPVSGRYSKRVLYGQVQRGEGGGLSSKTGNPPDGDLRDAEVQGDGKPSLKQVLKKYEIVESDSIPEMLYKSQSGEFDGEPKVKVKGIKSYVDLKVQEAKSDKQERKETDVCIAFASFEFIGCKEDFDWDMKKEIDCVINVERSGRNQVEVKVLTNQLTHVTISTDKNNLNSECFGKCSFVREAEKQIEVSCGNYNKRNYLLPTSLEDNCLFASTKFKPLKITAISVCLSTSYVKSVWSIIFIAIFLNVLSIALTIGTFRRILGAVLVRYEKLRGIVGAGYICNFCGEQITNVKLAVLHDQCIKKTCPYCERSGYLTSHPLHVSSCSMRSAAIDRAVLTTSMTKSSKDYESKLRDLIKKGRVVVKQRRPVIRLGIRYRSAIIISVIVLFFILEFAVAESSKNRSDHNRGLHATDSKVNEPEDCFNYDTLFQLSEHGFGSLQRGSHLICNRCRNEVQESNTMGSSSFEVPNLNNGSATDRLGVGSGEPPDSSNKTRTTSIKGTEKEHNGNSSALLRNNTNIRRKRSLSESKKGILLEHKVKKAEGYFRRSFARTKRLRRNGNRPKTRDQADESEKKIKGGPDSTDSEAGERVDTVSPATTPSSSLEQRTREEEGESEGKPLDSKQDMYNKIVHQEWGVFDENILNIDGTDSGSISLELQTSLDRGSSIVTKGSSIGYMKASPGSAVKWKVHSSTANEDKLISVVLVDIKQVYASSIKYITSDRSIKKNTETTCNTGCSSKCGSSRKNIYMKKWDNIRTPACNPPWCVKIEMGCSCCSAEMFPYAGNGFFSVWELQYISTELLISILIDSERIDTIIRGNGRLVHGSFTFSFTNVLSNSKELPTKVILYHSRNENGVIDTLKPTRILSNTEFCLLRNCPHGKLGDYQTRNLNNILAGELDLDSEWTSFIGVESTTVCHRLEENTCIFLNLKENVGDDINRTLDTSEDLSIMWDFSHIETRYTKAGGSMSLVVRPRDFIDNMAIFLEVDNLILERERTLAQVDQLLVTDCEGCHTCSDGFTCDLFLRSRQSKPLTVEIYTKTGGIVFSQVRYITSEVGSSHKLIGIAYLNVSEVEICVKGDPDKCFDIKIILGDPSKIVMSDKFMFASTHRGNSTGGWMMLLFNTLSIIPRITGMFDTIWKYATICFLILLLPLIINVLSNILPLFNVGFGMLRTIFNYRLFRHQHNN